MARPTSVLLKPFATLAVLSCLLAATATAGIGAETSRRVKNVVMIGVDDLRANLGCYGADWTQTPHLDRLAAMGVRFDRAYVNIPICNPSRVSFLSGLYPEKTGVLTNLQDPRDPQYLPDTKFFPEVFQDAGYFTATIGKTEHKQFQGQMDVDEFSNPQNSFKKSAIVDQGKVVDEFEWQAVDAPDNQFGDGKISERIVQLIQERADGEEPFFLHAGFHKPHRPWIAPKRFFDAHPPEAMPLMPQGIPAGPGTRGPLEGKRQIPVLDDDDERRFISIYAAATSFMDAQVGRIMKALDERDLWDSTLVIFYSDHGFSLGEHDMWSKFNQWRSTVRIPFIIVAPGVKPGVSDAVVELIDMYPTLMEMTGLEAPHELQGESLVEVLHDPQAQTDGLAYTVFGYTEGDARARVRSIRTPEYAYIRYYDGSDVLFSADDPNETVDLSEDPAHESTVERLRALVEQGPPFRQ
jgi:arylsulfatase A-like enzyme